MAEVEQWVPLSHSDRRESKQEWAEVCFVPNWIKLHSAFKQLALGRDWVRRRIKAVRFGLLHLAGRVVAHARQLLVRIQPSEALQTILAARQRLRALAHPSAAGESLPAPTCATTL